MHWPDWLLKPETFFAIGLFLIGVFVSVFSSDIRRLFSVPPRKWKKSRAARMQYRLNLMQRLHENPYRLLLYFIWSIAHTAWQIVISFFPALWVTSFIPVFTGKPQQPLTSSVFWLPATGVLSGWAWNLRRTVHDLYHYDDRKKYYEEQIQKLEPEAIVPPVRKQVDGQVDR
ncbi:MAG: hypothetical protein ACLQGV_07260 [Bryobacteraceae bacterium]